jgi:RNA polymerase sigma-B factor
MGGRPSSSGSRLDAATAQLFRRWRDDGDEAARNDLIERYLPLARGLAKRYRNSHDAWDDLVQVASVGLIGAIDRFDPDRGLAFQSFAVPTIVGEIKRYFRHTAWSAHVPRGVQELSLRVDRAAAALGDPGRPAPSVSQVAQYLEVSVEEVTIALDASASRYASSLDAPLGAAREDGEAATLGDTIGVEDDRLGYVEARASLADELQRLPRDERAAVLLRVEEGLKQTEIADRLGCSQMQVSRLLRRAAVHLRESEALSAGHAR